MVALIGDIQSSSLPTTAVDDACRGAFTVETPKESDRRGCFGFGRALALAGGVEVKSDRGRAKPYEDSILQSVREVRECLSL